LRPATGTFLVKSDALDGKKELFFYSFFGGFLKPPKNGLFPDQSHRLEFYGFFLCAFGVFAVKFVYRAW